VSAGAAARVRRADVDAKGALEARVSMASLRRRDVMANALQSRDGRLKRLARCPG